GGDIEGTRRSIARVSGGITFPRPTANEWADLKPWILWGTTLSAVPELRYVGIDRGDKVYVYDNVAGGTAPMSGTPGEPVSCEVSCVGIDETVGNSGTFPSLTYDRNSGPFIFSDLTTSIAGVGSAKWRSFTLTIQHIIDADRFLQSTRLTEVNCAGKRN